MSLVYARLWLRKAFDINYSLVGVPFALAEVIRGLLVIVEVVC